MSNNESLPLSSPELTQAGAVLYDETLALKVAASVIAYWRDRAQHDQMTGLQNKESWEAGIRERMTQGKPFGIITIDLNKFKAINDTLGHPAGDIVLIDFSNTLLKTFRRRDDRLMQETDDEFSDKTTVGRLGGDEMGIMFGLQGNMRRGTDPSERMDKEWAYFETVANGFEAEQPKVIRQLGFGVAFGAAVWYPENPLSLDVLLGQADESLLESKPENSR